MLNIKYIMPSTCEKIAYLEKAIKIATEINRPRIVEMAKEKLDEEKANLIKEQAIRV